jgi:predicted nucleic acid-binding Zn ribbon protein
MNEDEAHEEVRSRKSLRNAVIVFAVVEALILIPVVLYIIFR